VRVLELRPRRRVIRVGFVVRVSTILGWRLNGIFGLCCGGVEGGVLFVRVGVWERVGVNSVVGVLGVDECVEKS